MNLKSNSDDKATENVGRMGHETIGAEYLRSLGFSEKICRLVESHVPAKRYITPSPWLPQLLSLDLVLIRRQMSVW